MTTSGTSLDALAVACPCGAVTAAVSAPPAALFVCHCSACPPRDKTWKFAVPLPLAAGAPWVALPRLWTAKSEPPFPSALVVTRTSSFAVRSRCGICDAAVFIRYDCEAHTDWVHADVLAPAAALASLPPAAHINCGAAAATADCSSCVQGIYAGYEPWVPDPCRAPDTQVPEVCRTCFQLRTGCSCRGAW